MISKYKSKIDNLLLRLIAKYLHLKSTDERFKQLGINMALKYIRTDLLTLLILGIFLLLCLVYSGGDSKILLVGIVLIAPICSIWTTLITLKHHLHYLDETTKKSKEKSRNERKF